MLASDRRAPLDTAPWTDEDHQKLAELYAMSPRPSQREMARILGCTVSAMEHRAGRLNPSSFAKPTSQSKVRTCIRQCGRSFMSANFGHRICAMCKNNPEFQTAMWCA